MRDMFGLEMKCISPEDEIKALTRQIDEHKANYEAIETMLHTERGSWQARHVESLEKIADQNAEIEQLKGMVDEIQAARHVQKEHNKLLEKICVLQKQLHFLESSK